MNREHLYQIAYFSLSVEQMTEAQFDAIVQAAAEHNSRHNITGTLMASDSLFIQWLEGPMHPVRTLYERILQDDRHHCIVKLTEKEIFANRLFPDWSMRRTDRAEMLDILESAHQSATNEASSWETAISMLRTLLAQGAGQAEPAANGPGAPNTPLQS